MPTSELSESGKSHPKHRKWMLSILSVALIIVASVITLSYLHAPSVKLGTPKPVSETTSLFPTDNNIYVDNNATTGIIVEIRGAPDDAYFTVTTTSDGGYVPPAAGAPIAIKGTTVAGYYDIMVIVNVTLSPDINAAITITNLNIHSGSEMYFWNITRQEWLVASTVFQPPHSIVGRLPAIALTGTPFGTTGGGGGGSSGGNNGSGGNNNPTPTPAPTMFPVSEYAWGALTVTCACLGALALFRVRRKR